MKHCLVFNTRFNGILANVIEIAFPSVCLSVTRVSCELTEDFVQYLYTLPDRPEI